MKTEMAELDKLESALKEDLDRLMKERQICKEKCDKIKQNIRANRLKFVKNVEEFGEDHELNEDEDLEIKEQPGSNHSSKQRAESRASVAPSQAPQDGRCSQSSMML